MKKQAKLDNIIKLKFHILIIIITIMKNYNKVLKIYTCKEIVIFIMYLAEYCNQTVRKINFNIFAHIQI